MLEHIEKFLPELRKSERKVAQWVLSQPNAVLDDSLAVLAKQVGVSEPTVIRFCRAVGCKGFQDFKLRLAKSLATGARYAHNDVSPLDSPADVVGKVFDRAIAVLSRVRNQVRSEALEQAVGYLLNADHIEIYGVGTSRFVVQHAQQKFFLLGSPVVTYDDPRYQILAAESLAPGAVIVVISSSGENLDLMRAVEAARANGAVIISITGFNTPLAKRAAVNLAVDAGGETAFHDSLTEYLAHITVVDVLAAGVAARRGPELLKQLTQKREALVAKEAEGA
jgi:RpiR family transcriptional regulator, carbohydrate utilization regulator